MTKENFGGIKDLALQKKKDLEKEIALLDKELAELANLAVSVTGTAGQNSRTDSLYSGIDNVGLSIIKILENNGKGGRSNQKKINVSFIKKILEKNHEITVSEGTIYKRLNLLEDRKIVKKIKSGFWVLVNV